MSDKRSVELRALMALGERSEGGPSAGRVTRAMVEATLKMQEDKPRGAVTLHEDDLLAFLDLVGELRRSAERHGELHG